jgi:hypothetical protein
VQGLGAAALADDPRLGGELGKVDLLLAGEGVAGGQDDEQVVVEQLHGNQSGGCGQGGVVEGDGQVALGALEQGKRLVGAGLDERDGDIGAAGGQVGEGGGYEGGVAAGQGGQPHVAGGGAGERGELRLGGGQLGGDRVAAGDQGVAGVG